MNVKCRQINLAASPCSYCCAAVDFFPLVLCVAIARSLAYLLTYLLIRSSNFFPSYRRFFLSFKRKNEQNSLRNPMNDPNDWSWEEKSTSTTKATITNYTRWYSPVKRVQRKKYKCQRKRIVANVHTVSFRCTERVLLLRAHTSLRMKAILRAVISWYAKNTNTETHREREPLIQLTE